MQQKKPNQLDASDRILCVRCVQDNPRVEKRKVHAAARRRRHHLTYKRHHERSVFHKWRPIRRTEPGVVQLICTAASAALVYYTNLRNATHHRLIRSTNPSYTTIATTTIDNYNNSKSRCKILFFISICPLLL